MVHTGVARAGRRALAAAVAVAVAVLGVALPGKVSAGEWKACVDTAFADYNSCLMSAGGKFDRWLCDIDFELDIVLCSAKFVGDVKEAMK
jgi:hypothetical protein